MDTMMHDGDGLDECPQADAKPSLVTFKTIWKMSSGMLEDSMKASTVQVLYPTCSPACPLPPPPFFFWLKGPSLFSSYLAYCSFQHIHFLQTTFSPSSILPTAPFTAEHSLHAPTPHGHIGQHD